jgi:hypothetical protein
MSTIVFVLGILPSAMTTSTARVTIRNSSRVHSERIEVAELFLELSAEAAASRSESGPRTSSKAGQLGTAEMMCLSPPPTKSTGASNADVGLAVP